MDDLTADDTACLVDIAGISLAELRVRDDSPFGRCVRRVLEECDDPEALTVVAFQSAVQFDRQG